ncbi:unnamed protein product, partial [Nesidiocoris tenuis]
GHGEVQGRWTKDLPAQHGDKKISSRLGEKVFTEDGIFQIADSDFTPFETYNGSISGKVRTIFFQGRL